MEKNLIAPFIKIYWYVHNILHKLCTQEGLKSSEDYLYPHYPRVSKLSTLDLEYFLLQGVPLLLICHAELELAVSQSVVLRDTAYVVFVVVL